MRPTIATLTCAAALLLGSVGCEAPKTHGPRPEAAHVAPAGIERRIEAHLRFLASDELGGRETGSVHAGAVDRYVESVFVAEGLAPGGDPGEYLQRWPLVTTALDLEQTSLTLGPAGHGPALVLAPVTDFVMRGGGPAGFDLSAALVYAGHGIALASAGVDDYAGLPVHGRVAVVVDGRPSTRDDLRAAAQWRGKRDAAREAGAVGLLILTDGEDRNSVNTLRWLSAAMTGGSRGLPPGTAEPGWPIVTLTGEASLRCATALGLDLPAERAALEAGERRGRELGEAGLVLHAVVSSETTMAANVLGVVPGSDPALADEYVILTAHNDHVGIEADGDVNNGADDNASGTTVLLAAAQWLAAGPPPRRSVVFASVSGEEMGLLGSEWWTTHPTRPLAQCVANVNIDMVGRNDPAGVGATPSPAHEQHNTLVARAAQLAPLAGLSLSWDAPAGSGDMVDDYYGRSDHYNFAAQGIPVVFFFSGLHEDYHKPGDELPKIDRAKLLKVTDLVVRLVRDTADADGRPQLLAPAR